MKPANYTCKSCGFPTQVVSVCNICGYCLYWELIGCSECELRLGCSEEKEEK